MPRDDAHRIDILKAARLAIEFSGAVHKVEEVCKMVASDLPEQIKLVSPLAPDR